ncbi:MAG: alpha/beta fold hydrolase [Solirubrobacterales bacterium]|nr:alpha/beta fold hydrolase [Solirubrobacterales bacterium]
MRRRADSRGAWRPRPGRELTERVREWRAAGHSERFGERAIHVFERPGAEPALLLLHGFPSSSYDWRALLARERERAVLAFDFLGFGLSDKPRDHVYSLLGQADLAEDLVCRRGPGGPVFVVAHDMGTSVATELLARDLDGRLGIEIAGALLFNGSIVLERASLTVAQRLLRGRFGALFAALASERVFRHQFAALFSAAHPLRAEEAEDQWSLIRHAGGRALGHRLIHYLDEREAYAERWHGAVRDWHGPLSLAWGLRDPVATPAVLAALRELRPSAPVVELPELGHYPQIEDPARLAEVVRRAAVAG